ncbi:MAG: TetR/AcrR family transcriptional regulator [Dermatophilaceae bacterium]
MTGPTLSRKRTQTRLKLLTAAAEVYVERGILGSSVEQICERAGFTRGAFYSNFESREALCLELLERQRLFYQDAFARGVADTVAHFAAHPQDRQLPPYDLVGLALDLVVPHLFQTRAQDQVWTMAGLLYGEMWMYAVREPSFREPFAAYERSWSQPFAVLLEQVFQAGGLTLTTSVAEAIHVLSAVFERSTRDALVSDDPGARIERVRADLLGVARLITRPR